MSRGEYQPMFLSGRAARPFVGAVQGGIVHLAQDVEHELDQFHSEFMQFGQELIDQAFPTGAEALAEAKAAGATDAQINMAGGPPGLVAAHAAKEAYSPRATPAMRAWYHGVWKPFADAWLTFRSTVKDIPLQMWPGSGVWDRVQEFREKFAPVRAGAIAAGFHILGPDPTPPRYDVSLTGGVTDVLKMLKYTVIGVLAIGGMVAIGGLVSDMKSGRDPTQKYLALAKGR